MTKSKAKTEALSLALSDIEPIEGEPRIADIHLARALGYSQPTDIRELITRNLFELHAFGILPCRTAKIASRGRPPTAYYLNEGQALTLCALSRTPAAARIRHALISVFMEWRREKPVNVREHNRAAPTRIPRSIDPTASLRADMESFFRAYASQPDVLADWAVENIVSLRHGLAGLCPNGRIPSI